MEKPIILYVEDEENDAFFMRLAFKRIGMEPTILQHVPDGQQALAYLSGDAPYTDRAKYPLPHVILLDLNLPLLSGFEVLEWIRQQIHLQEVPVVIFSSSGRPEDRNKAQRSGANEYVLKPASGAGFVEVARQLMKQWMAPQPVSDTVG